MGLKMFKTSSCDCAPSSVQNSGPNSDQNSGPNPDPKNFTVQHHVKMGDYVILIVRYPNCTTFEGKKILVFRGVGVRKLLALTELDPHFCDDPSHPSPIARFRPDDGGWEDAVRFCSSR